MLRDFNNSEEIKLIMLCEYKSKGQLQIGCEDHVAPFEEKWEGSKSGTV